MEKKKQIKFHQNITYFYESIFSKYVGKLTKTDPEEEIGLKNIQHENMQIMYAKPVGKSFFAKSDMKRHIDAVHLKKPDVWKRQNK